MRKLPIYALTLEKRVNAFSFNPIRRYTMQAANLEKDVEVKGSVREAYAKVAIADNEGKSCGTEKSCCGTGPDKGAGYSTRLGYSENDISAVPEGSNMGLGCGNPTAIAGLKAGEVVLDLGSGGGFDCFLAARQLAGTGRVIGVDMTPEMLSKARLNAQKGGYKNVEFRLGEIEHLPVENSSVDVIISNCVINLSTDKSQVFKEAARVLKPGGRLIISDLVATSPLPENIKRDLALYNGCMAGATPIEELKQALRNAGLEDIKIDVKEESRSFIKDWSTSGVENYVASAIIEAYRPSLELKRVVEKGSVSPTLGRGFYDSSNKQQASAAGGQNSLTCTPGSGCCPTKM